MKKVLAEFGDKGRWFTNDFAYRATVSGDGRRPPAPAKVASGQGGFFAEHQNRHQGLRTCRAPRSWQGAATPRKGRRRVARGQFQSPEARDVQRPRYLGSWFRISACCAAGGRARRRSQDIQSRAWGHRDIQVARSPGHAGSRR